MSKNSRKNKLNKKISAKKEKYLKFETGKDERIATRSRVPDRIVPQTLVNENDENVAKQMRKLHATRFKEKDKKR
ncbi:TPA: hypothetical protein HA251_03090 [Candidatus Woesearchaeota archaeon]|nr:hypothetical protein [Candidatus Woesearchaeota archaeon]